MMLWKVFDAHGRKLPENVFVTFANTGKEREETLRFVHECGSRLGVKIHWLEYKRRERNAPREAGFTELRYNSASRNGEPFAGYAHSLRSTTQPDRKRCDARLELLSTFRPLKQA